jgi:hypothetical protein
MKFVGFFTREEESHRERQGKSPSSKPTSNGFGV